jgi:chaperonin GroES
MKINPLTKHVVAKLETPAKKTASGLLLPDTNKEQTAYATVESVGPDVKNIKVGDKIIYKEYSTTNVDLENGKYIIVEDKDVLATL